jgi:hypothetical protein
VCGAPIDEHLDERDEAHKDAKGAQLASRLGLGQVLAKLGVGAGHFTKRAHKLHHGAVDERRLDLRRLLLALCKRRAPARSTL